MGKNRDLNILIRLIVNTVVHKIVVKHTNRPESKHFLKSEVIEYRNQTEDVAKSHNWNDDDRNEVRNIAFLKIKDKLKSKYSDVLFEDIEISENLNKIISELM